MADIDFGADRDPAGFETGGDGVAGGSSISKIIIGVANTIGMPFRICPTVRSGGTTRVRSALMPIVMTSRASIGRPCVPRRQFRVHGRP